MILIGVNRSPYTRRVAVTLHAYGVPYEAREINAFDNRAEVRASNPLARVPALVLDDGETLIDSGAIVDHLDETYGGERPLTPRTGADRRAVLKLAALMMGACGKPLQALYVKSQSPPEKVHQPWIDDCTTQVSSALSAVDATIRTDRTYLLLGHLTHADIAAFVAERLARISLAVDTDARMPRPRAFTKRLLEEALFRDTEPPPLPPPR
jgi:glutathione S-transferase